MVSRDRKARPPGQCLVEAAPHAVELLGRPESDLKGVFESVEEALAALEADALPFVAAGTITLAGEVAGLIRRDS